MKRFSKVKYPNKLFGDKRLTRTAKVVGGVLYAYRNALGVCRKSYDELANLAGVSSDTAAKAVRELKAAGYITMANTHYYDKKKGRVVRGKNVYSCDLNALKAGYTFLPREIFAQSLTIGQRFIYIGLYVSAGNQRKAFPSIREIQQATGCARSTVCEALKVLKKLPGLLVQLCRKRSGAFTRSAYHFCTVAAARVQKTLIPLCCHREETAAPIRSRTGRIERWLRGVRAKVRAFFLGVRGSPIFRKLC